jgi:hypothetical protein
MVLVIARQRLDILQGPQPEPAPKGRLVMAQPGARRQLLQVSGKGPMLKDPERCQPLRPSRGLALVLPPVILRPRHLCARYPRPEVSRGQASRV